MDGVCFLFIVKFWGVPTGYFYPQNKTNDIIIFKKISCSVNISFFIIHYINVLSTESINQIKIQPLCTESKYVLLSQLGLLIIQNVPFILFDIFLCWIILIRDIQ